MADKEPQPPTPEESLKPKPADPPPPKREDKAPSEPKQPRPKLRAPSANAEQKQPPKRSPGRPPGMAKKITDFYDNIGMVVGIVSMEDGAEIMNVSEPAGEAWAKLCQENPSVKRAWDRILTGNAWSAVIMVHAPLIYSIASNHGLVPELHNPFGNDGDTPSGV